MKCWALIEFIDTNGVKHEVDGQEIDLPRNTDTEKSSFARLEEYGVITTKPREAEATMAPAEDPSGRTGRKRT